jgi:pimeloyl-ACP methyl ester carboxylesterase
MTLATTAPRTGYAPVNGLEMYYEIHGSGRPLLLLHGALSATETSFGAVLPALAESRQVISAEQQAHGRTADIDRPLRTTQMAADSAALLRHLGIDRVDVLGYSMGAAIALELAIRQPELVRKVVAVSIAYNTEGLHPGLLAGLEGLRPEHLAGTPWQQEYARTAPRPEDYPRMVAKVTDLNMNIQSWPAEAVSSMKAPILIVIGDSDIVTPEHAVEMFRLVGGGVVGDTAGLPASQLAILPGTPHSTIMQRADLLVPMIQAFLDAPLPERA